MQPEQKHTIERVIARCTEAPHGTSEDEFDSVTQCYHWELEEMCSDAEYVTDSPEGALLERINSEDIILFSHGEDIVFGLPDGRLAIWDNTERNYVLIPARTCACGPDGFREGCPHTAQPLPQTRHFGHEFPLIPCSSGCGGNMQLHHHPRPGNEAMRWECDSCCCIEVADAGTRAIIAAYDSGDYYPMTFKITGIEHPHIDAGLDDNDDVVAVNIDGIWEIFREYRRSPNSPLERDTLARIQ